MKGFTILEVIIATAIASVISVALFIALRQTMAYQERVDTFVDTYTRAALIQNQLERDFMGFFVPNQAYELVSSSTKSAAPGAEKKKPEQIDKIFYAAASKEQFQLLSFTTTNAMQVYWGKAMGAPKPLVARVVYRLIKDKEYPDSFILTRQESAQLDFTAFEGPAEKQKIRAYEIVSDIKEMKVTYFARVYKVEDKVSPSTQASPKATPGKQGEVAPSVRPEELRDKKKELPTWTYKEFSQWDWSPKKAKPKDGKPGEKPNESEKKGEQPSRVPMYIKVNLVLWNAEHTRTMPFEFVFVRKPFEMKELEKDTQPQEQKPAPQMPNIKPMLDLFKIPTASAVPQNQILPVTQQNSHPRPPRETSGHAGQAGLVAQLPQQRQNPFLLSKGGR